MCNLKLYEFHECNINYMNDLIVSIIEHTSLNKLSKCILSRSHRVEQDYTGGVGNITQNFFFATAQVSGGQVAPKL